jgi:hypothetical protein
MPHARERHFSQICPPEKSRAARRVHVTGSALCFPQAALLRRAGDTATPRYSAWAGRVLLGSEGAASVPSPLELHIRPVSVRSPVGAIMNPNCAANDWSFIASGASVVSAAGGESDHEVGRALAPIPQVVERDEVAAEIAHASASSLRFTPKAYERQLMARG